MSDELLATSTISRRDGGYGSICIPSRVDEFIGGADEMAWFVDDSGLIYIVPFGEVTIRGRE